MISDHSDKAAAASIHLDYGADSADFSFEDLHVCQRGLQIRTRWSFAPGTELSVNFQIADAANSGNGCGGRILRTEGIVVDCARDERCGGYLVTMLFLEITDDIRAVIRDFSEEWTEEESANS